MIRTAVGERLDAARERAKQTAMALAVVTRLIKSGKLPPTDKLGASMRLEAMEATQELHDAKEAFDAMHWRFWYDGGRSTVEVGYECIGDLSAMGTSELPAWYDRGYIHGVGLGKMHRFVVPPTIKCGCQWCCHENAAAER